MNEAWIAMLASVEKRRDADARFYKPVCLIAVIDGIADGSLAPSDLGPDQVIARFGSYIGESFPDRAALGWRPFWHLSRDGAWTFTREGKPVGPDDFKRQRKPNSRRELMSKIDMVAVPPALRPHWRSPADRAELRTALIGMLRRDNADCQKVADRLDGTTPVRLPDSDIVKAVRGTRPAMSGNRQGFQRSPAARQSVEARAMQVARAVLEQEGWAVEDVSARRSYDLHCTRGDEIRYVEIKGTTGSGAEIQITAAEVAFANQNREQMRLVLVTGIELTGEGDGVSATGGSSHVIESWAPEPGDLDPISYFCRVALPSP